MRSEGFKQALALLKRMADLGVCGEVRIEDQIDLAAFLIVVFPVDAVVEFGMNGLATVLVRAAKSPHTACEGDTAKPVACGRVAFLDALSDE